MKTCLFLLVMGLAALPLRAELGPEMIRNPGFELDADEDGLPDQWATTHDRLILRETVFMGQNAAITSKPPTYVLATQDLTLEKGKQYTLSLRAKGHGGGIGGVLIVHGETRPEREMPLLWNMDLTQDFQEYTRVFTAPNPVARLYLYNLAKETGTVTYDHVSLRQGVPDHALISQFSVKDIDKPTGPPKTYPRIRYGSPLAGGPLRAMITIRHFRCLRQVVELQQRVDLDTDVVHTGYDGKECVSDTGRRAMQRLRDGFYEVYIVPSRVPEALAEDIRERVAQGAGLVIVEGFARTSQLVESDTLEPAAAEHPLRHVFPYEHMPEKILADIDVGQLGAGRVVRLQFPMETSRVWGLMPAEIGAHAWKQRQFEYWEWWEALIGEAARWAARGDASTSVTAQLADGGTAVQFSCRGDAAESLRVTLRNAREIRFDQSPPLRVDDVHLPLNRQGIASLPIPEQLQAGTVFADVSVLDGDGNVGSWKAFALERPTAAQLGSIQLPETVFQPGDAVPVTVTVTAQSPGEAILEARLIDAHGRIVDSRRTQVDLEPPDIRRELRPVLRTPLLVFHRLEVRLLIDGREHDRQWQAVTVPTLGPERAASDFTVIPWHPGMSHPLLVQRYTEIMEDIGQNGDFPSTGYLGSELGMPAAGYMPGMGTSFRETHQRDDKVRSVCLHEDETRQAIADKARAAAEEGREFGLFAVGITDEAFLTSRHHRNEVCFSPASQEAYRQWLQKRYDSLDALNAQWGTTHQTWGNVTGTTTEQIRGKPNAAPFVDFRTFMTDTWIDTCRLAVDAYHEINPDVRVGHTNTFGANPFNGNDYWKLATQTAFGWGQEYSEAIKPTAHKAVFDLWRSFRSQDFPNYGWIGYHHAPEAASYEPWWLALHGSRGVSYYSTSSLDPVRGVSWALVYPTLSPTAYALEVKKALADLKAGCGKLIMEYEREQTDIALLWSHPSMLVAWCESSWDQPVPDERPGCDSYGSYFRSALDIRQHINELQMDYRYVAPQQLLEDTLERQPKLLFLPFTVAASPELVDRLESFVRQGGVLVGDLRCLRTDDHGTPFNASEPMQRLFGAIRAEGAPVDYEPSSIRFAKTTPHIDLAGQQAEVIGKEQLTVAADAVALAEHPDGTPAVVVKKAGEGMAIYWNFRLPEYDPTMRECIAQIMTAAGISRPVTVESTDDDYTPRCFERNSFHRGPLSLHAFIRDFRRCDRTESVTVRLPARAHIYDVREGRYLGRENAIGTEMAPGDTALFACLPYRVAALDLSLQRQEGDITVNAAVQADTEPLGHHVIHVDVRRPDGTAMATYPRNLAASAGFLIHRVPLAVNRPTGKWTVSVRDVLSGTTARQTILME